MSVPRVLFSLLVFGSLGVIAITLSGFAPAGSAPALDSPATSSANLSGTAHSRLQEWRNCLQQDSHCPDLYADSLPGIVLAPPAEDELPSTLRILTETAEPRATEPGHLPVPASVGLPVASLNPPVIHEDERAGDGDATAWPAADWSKHTLRQGEHLAALWNSSWGLRLPTLYQLVADPDNARLLDVVHPGQEIEWQVDPNGELKRLRLWATVARGHEWVRLDGTDQFSRAEISSEREIHQRVLSGEVRGPLASSLAETVNLPPASADAIGRLLQDHLPLGESARDGDQYTLLVEIETLVGDHTPYDIRLLAFAFVGATQMLTAIRHLDGLFYTPEGRPLQSPFDRHPFKGDFRITSGFSKGRRHPVTGRVAPHNGTDFSMPVGTPVVAPADGRVVKVESHPLAGKFVEIEHGQGFSTRYLHLQKALVETGQQVTRGQRIALSGNSGRTTSAHLHYEIHVNGRPVDPMRVELPRGEPLRGSELALFQRAALPVLAELREAAASRQLAMQPYTDYAP